MRDNWRNMADVIAWCAILKSLFVPIDAILSGTLWGPVAFVGGAFIVTTIIFTDSYFGASDADV